MDLRCWGWDGLLALVIAGLLEFTRVVQHVHACIFNQPVVRLEAGLGLLHRARTYIQVTHLLQLVDHLVPLVLGIYRQNIMSITPIRILQSLIIPSAEILDKSG